MDPVLHPGTGQLITPDDLAPLFPMSLIEQEVLTERWIPISKPVRDILLQWRCNSPFTGPAVQEGFRYPGQDLLQVRGRQPEWITQAEHGRCPGVLQQGGLYQENQY